MHSNKFWSAAGKLLAVMTAVVIVILAFAPATAAASKYKVLHKFSNDREHLDGTSPYGGLIFDTAGNIYGTTAWGWGDPCYWHGCGTAFRLTPNENGSWTETIILNYDFLNTDPGSWPMAGLVLDASGNLYGTTAGDYQCCGRVIAGSPNLDGSWSWRELHSFTGPEGARPYAGLIWDESGKLYGTTTEGGAYGYGVVFELTPNPDGSWTESVLYTFSSGKDGANPYAGLVFDSTGSLYGTTAGGGSAGCGGPGCGIVYKLTSSGSNWKETVLHRFSGGKDGANPYAGLIFDGTGNLYGTTNGGGSYGYGIVFNLTPNPNGSWKEKVLHHFTGGKDGANPYAAVALDPTGNLYGTTWNGGSHGYGTVFRLALGLDGKWREHVLHAFAGKPGKNPYAGVTLDSVGKIYGTTAGGESDCSYWSDCGTVYEITP